MQYLGIYFQILYRGLAVIGVWNFELGPQIPRHPITPLLFPPVSFRECDALPHVIDRIHENNEQRGFWTVATGGNSSGSQLVFKDGHHPDSSSLNAPLALTGTNQIATSSTLLRVSMMILQRTTPPRFLLHILPFTTAAVAASPNLTFNSNSVHYPSLLYENIEQPSVRISELKFILRWRLPRLNSGHR
jgi:hypothetical protein